MPEPRSVANLRNQCIPSPEAQQRRLLRSIESLLVEDSSSHLRLDARSHAGLACPVPTVRPTSQASLARRAKAATSREVHTRGLGLSGRGDGSWSVLPAPAARESASQTPGSIAIRGSPVAWESVSQTPGPVTILGAGGWRLESFHGSPVAWESASQTPSSASEVLTPLRRSPGHYALGYVLGRGDSNLRMAAPKAAAFPLGDALECHIFRRPSRDADILADEFNVLGQDSVLHALAEVAVQSILAARSRCFNSRRGRRPVQSP